MELPVGAEELPVGAAAGVGAVAFAPASPREKEKRRIAVKMRVRFIIVANLLQLIVGKEAIDEL